MKLEERVMRYGAEAYAKMRGIKGKISIKKEVERLKNLFPKIFIKDKKLAPYISRSQRSYWKDVKALAKARDMPIKKTRKLLKRLKTAKNVQVRIIKSGEGFQLIMLGLYENVDKEDISFKQREESEGHSYIHYEEDFHESYDEALAECIAESQAKLGGSGWELVKILKETWIRYYGREE
jgi:transcriptional regulator